MNRLGLYVDNRRIRVQPFCASSRTEVEPCHLVPAVRVLIAVHDVLLYMNADLHRLRDVVSRCASAARDATLGCGPAVCVELAAKDKNAWSGEDEEQDVEQAGEVKGNNADKGSGHRDSLVTVNESDIAHD